MSKDPAVLWYFNDWNGGVSTFNRHTKGAYMDLLYAQWNKGPLSLQEIKNVLGQDFEQEWLNLEEKFNGKDETTGKIFNVKLHEEMVKRKRFTDSRRNNLNPHKSAHTHPHTVSRMVNVNEDVNVFDIEKEEWFPKNWQTDYFRKAWRNWLEFRKEIKEPIRGPRSEAGQIKKLNKLSEGNVTVAVEIIEQSIGNNWRGLFPLKDSGKKVTAKSEWEND